MLACIEDILQAAPGLHYVREVDAAAAKRSDRPFATLTVETNPLCDLTLSIELTADACNVVVNGRRYTRRRPGRLPFEWWVERRCRDVMAMVSGDLRLQTQSLLSYVMGCKLLAGAGKRWRPIGTFDNGWISALSFLLPFGLLLLTREKTVDYADWFRVA
jgi:hypothetical protein